MLNHTKMAIAASTVGLGAMVVPATAQSAGDSQDFHYVIPEYDPNASQATSNNPSAPGIGCGGLLIAGGIGAAAIASARNRNSQDEESTLHSDREAARRWEQQHGGANRDQFQNKNR